MYEVILSPAKTLMAGPVTATVRGRCLAHTNQDCSSQYSCPGRCPYWSTGCRTGYPGSGACALKPGQRKTVPELPFFGSWGTVKEEFSCLKTTEPSVCASMA